MKVQYYTKKDFKTSSWSGGKTTELLIFPPGASYEKRDFLLRLSSATVDVPISKFTHLEGITRFISTLTYPILLEVDDGEPVFLSPLKIFKFNGSAKTTSYGMSRDFNLMVRDESIKSFICSSNYEKELCIEKVAYSTVWLFNFFQTVHITIEKCEHEMEPFSLLTLQCEKESQVEIKMREATRLIYGAFA